MIQITLSDNSIREFQDGSTGLDIAKSISKGLAQNVLAVKVDNEVWDATRPINKNANITLLTWEDAEGKATFWHSSAHLLAEALEALYPGIKLTIGPSIENGFYYDVDFGNQEFSSDDLPQVEKKMIELAKQKSTFQCFEVSKSEAKEYFTVKGNPYKVELIEGLEDGHITFYKQGEFTDLCKGPHLPNTGFIKAIKLTSIAGAYWRGDEKNKMLTRIYGITFPKAEELTEYLEKVEQAKLRDHRIIGKQLKVYHLSPEVGSGLPLWLPNGTIIREELEFLAKGEEFKSGYERVVTPHITNEKLYYQSGHLPYYKADMYPPLEIDGNNYYLRPMNCPHHHHIYLSEPRSYRDLPVRLSEYGQVYRYEDSGALSGLMRTRGFCQNDAHIYCTYEQAKEEFINVMHMHAKYYKLFGIEHFYMRLSLPDLNKLDKYVDEPGKWLAALQIIRDAMNESGYPYKEVEGEAAFYGPKIDFMIKSVVGAEHAISTNQLDFLASERFSLTYIGEDGQEHPVYVIHRAPLGSHERFIAFLIEHYNGKLPFWLSPVQVIVIPIADKHIEYAKSIKDYLNEVRVVNASQNLRVKIDSSNERMQKKIRNATLQRIPITILVGDDEINNNTVSLRMLDGQNFNGIEKEMMRNVLIEAAENRSDVRLTN